MKLQPVTIYELKNEVVRGIDIARDKINNAYNQSNLDYESEELIREFEIAHVALTAAIQIARTIRASEDQEYEFGIKPTEE